MRDIIRADAERRFADTWIRPVGAWLAACLASAAAMVGNPCGRARTPRTWAPWAWARWTWARWAWASRAGACRLRACDRLLLV